MKAHSGFRFNEEVDRAAKDLWDYIIKHRSNDPTSSDVKAHIKTLPCMAPYNLTLKNCLALNHYKGKDLDPLFAELDSNHLRHLHNCPFFDSPRTTLLTDLSMQLSLNTKSVLVHNVENALISLYQFIRDPKITL